jgi:SpoVK/Ycf46/Vps4 family AAA+-type ATPase
MDNEELLSNLKAFEEALRVSPDNLPLRSLYVDSLIKAGRATEAMEGLKILISHQPQNPDHKLKLAQIYYQRLETGKAIVLIEDLVKSGNASDDIVTLYIALLLEEKNYAAAADVYQEMVSKTPSLRNEEIESLLKDYINSDFQRENNVIGDWEGESGLSVPVEKPKIKFEDVGGMTQVKEEIAFKIIRPMQHKELFATYGKKAGGGILLYGPPGCGKTYIARATAGETGSCFISVGIHNVLDMFIGNSEKNLHAIFEYARRNTPTVLFFDEVDALGASRTDMKTSAGRHLINQFLMEFDGDKYSNENVLVLGATNTPWHLDPAFIRPGRFDRIIFVPPPDKDARAAILKVILRDKPTKDIDYQEISKKTEGFSGADLTGFVDIAVESLLREVLHSGKEEPLTTKHLMKALKSIKPSTKEWFSTAKNYAVYSNESGLYDDISKYLSL